MKVSKLKVEKSAYIEKLKRSVEVKKEMRDTITAEFKLLLEANKLKSKFVFNHIHLTLANIQLKVSTGEDRLKITHTEVLSLRDKAEK